MSAQAAYQKGIVAQRRSIGLGASKVQLLRANTRSEQGSGSGVPTFLHGGLLWPQPAHPNPTIIIESDHPSRLPSAHLVIGPRTAPLRVFPERFRDHHHVARSPTINAARRQHI